MNIYICTHAIIHYSIKRRKEDKLFHPPPPPMEYLQHPVSPLLQQYSALVLSVLHRLVLQLMSRAMLQDMQVDNIMIRVTVDIFILLLLTDVTTKLTQDCSCLLFKAHWPVFPGFPELNI